MNCKIGGKHFLKSEENHAQFFGQVLVHFTFEMNADVILIHQPEETWHSGEHTILLYYPIENVVPNITNTFNVYMRVSGGTCSVDTGN